MPLSNYVKCYPQKDKPGHYLLFSTKRSSKIVLNDSILDAIKSNLLSPKSKKLLLDLGMIVEDPEKEREEMRSYLEKHNSRRNYFCAVVMMNLDCNLACTYCFEGTLKGEKLYMSRETADKVIRYTVENHIEKGDSVKLTFYGGEPLLSFDLLHYIATKIKSAASKNGVEFSFGFVTNGTLFTPKRAEQLVELGLKYAQITLDGPPEFHNKTRPLKSGNDSFDIIFKNVKNICDIFPVQIVGNCTKFNYREFPRLLDIMIENGLTPDKIPSVQFAGIMQTGAGMISDFKDGCQTVNEPWVYELSLFLREESLKRGFDVYPMGLSICSIELDKDLVIGYDGALYKCPAFVGRPEFKVGSIESGMVDYKTSHKIGFWKNERCLKCAYLPMCFGGCREMKLQRDGNFETVDCKKPFFDAVLEGFIRQEIKYNKRVG